MSDTLIVCLACEQLRAQRPGTDARFAVLHICARAESTNRLVATSLVRLRTRAAGQDGPTTELSLVRVRP